ncbi:Phosphatidylinositol glycan class V, related [Neospora caninum Liverpool]|uniref:Phosphatidylinositol glycan class V, related n=1 Tax=Neospora caninum (strain Liverpool) TaxID=572307 RepID=F0VJF0_NEOCL|nr:Phosphatidylinositol glycan class V, related [Neospora caninum Liverpool]CBZ53861.1 Phosphatidylinositol glycan class V, related [Neospora caninum Liverpool]|eukprot:XP_003883893.1 Phosphatidylinositol glycan class V, related [Neospora caninum Liverpool]
MPAGAQLDKPLKAGISRLRLRVVVVAFLSRLFCLSLTCFWAHRHPAYNSQSSLLHPTAVKRQDYISSSLLEHRLSSPHSSALRHFHPFHLTDFEPPRSHTEEGIENPERAEFEKAQPPHVAPQSEKSRVLVLEPLTEEAIAPLFPEQGASSGVPTRDSELLTFRNGASTFLPSEVIPVSALPPWGRDPPPGSFDGAERLEPAGLGSRKSGGSRASSAGLSATRLSSSVSSPASQSSPGNSRSSPASASRIDDFVWRFVVPFLSWDGEYFVVFALQETAYYFELTHAFFPGLSLVYIHLGGFLRRVLSQACRVAQTAWPRFSFFSSETPTDKRGEEFRSNASFDSPDPLHEPASFLPGLDDATVYGLAAVLVSNLAFIFAALGVFEVARLHLAAEAESNDSADKASPNCLASATVLSSGRQLSLTALVPKPSQIQAHPGSEAVQASCINESENDHVEREDKGDYMVLAEKRGNEEDEREQACRIAFLAAGWFSFSAASIHMSAAYTESLFAALNTWGLYLLLVAERTAGLRTSRCCLDTRGNLLHCGENEPKAAAEQRRREGANRKQGVTLSPRAHESGRVNPERDFSVATLRKCLLLLPSAFLLRWGATFLFCLASFLRSNGSVALVPLFFHTLRTCPLIRSLRTGGDMRARSPPKRPLLRVSPSAAGDSASIRETCKSRDGDKSAANTHRCSGDDDKREAGPRAREDVGGCSSTTEDVMSSAPCLVCQNKRKQRRSYGRLLVATGAHWIVALLQAIAVVLPIFLVLAYPYYLYCACPKTSEVAVPACNVASAFLGQAVRTPYSRGAEAGHSGTRLPSSFAGSKGTRGSISSSLGRPGVVPALSQNESKFPSTLPNKFRHTLTFSQFAYDALAVGLPRSIGFVFSLLRRLRSTSLSSWVSEAKQATVELALNSSVTLDVHAVGKDPATNPVGKAQDRGVFSEPFDDSGDTPWGEGFTNTWPADQLKNYKEQRDHQSGLAGRGVPTGSGKRSLSDSILPVPQWCQARIPNIYPWIQREYWDVYFLGFFRFKKLYLILLALPFYFLALSCILFFLHRAWRARLRAGRLDDDEDCQGMDEIEKPLAGEKLQQAVEDRRPVKHSEHPRRFGKFVSLCRQGSRVLVAALLDPAFGEIFQLTLLMMFMFLCGNTNPVRMRSKQRPLMCFSKTLPLA